jgi:hypothetical protein
MFREAVMIWGLDPWVLIGRDALDNSGTDRAARVTAFLNVELFRVMYDQNKGNALPPPPAIERQMEQLGVSPKQKERARQTFMKSAQYASFIDQATGRFVKPGNASAKQDGTQHDQDKDDLTRRKGGGGPKDPLIDALIDKLPNVGPWPVDDRINWVKMLLMAFQVTYGNEPEIEIKKHD